MLRLALTFSPNILMKFYTHTKVSKIYCEHKYFFHLNSPINIFLYLLSHVLPVLD